MNYLIRSLRTIAFVLRTVGELKSRHTPSDLYSMALIVIISSELDSEFSPTEIALARIPIESVGVLIWPKKVIAVTVEL